MTLLLPLFLAWFGPVSGPARPAAEKDAWNAIEFEPVAADAGRPDVRPAGDHSSGIPERTVE